MTCPLRIGLMGCGAIAQSVHLGVLLCLPDAQLVALAEPDRERRDLAGTRVPRAKVYTHYLDLLDAPDVDAVVACVPTPLHAEVAIAALNRGKHVYLEKPLATSLAEATQVIDAWNRSNAKVMIGFNYRFHALYQSARQCIESGKIGGLISAHSVFSSTARHSLAWKQERKPGGSALLNLASHHIDLVHFLFGQEVCDVFAGLPSQRGEADTAILQLRLADGFLVHSFFSMNGIDEDRFEIYGQKGKLAVDRYHSLNVEITKPARDLSRLRHLRYQLRSLARSTYLLNKILAPDREPSYRIALAHFVAAVQGKRPATPDFWDGYRSLAVIEAAEKSAETGRVVSLGNRIDADSTC